MDFWLEDIGFDYAIDRIEGDPEECGNRVVEEKKDGDCDPADELAEHWDDTTNHCDHTHRESKIVLEMEGSGDNENEDGG